MVETRTAAPTVFSYVASRNKRGRPTVGKGLELPYSDLTVGRTPGVTAIFDAKRRIAGLPRGRRPARAVLRTARAQPIHRPVCRVRPRRAPHAPLKRRPRRGRRFCESRYSLSTYNSSPPAESSNELRRVAARRVGWRRTARPKGSQEQCPKPGQQLSPIHCPNLSPMLSPARRENRLRFSRPKNEHSPKLAPVLCPVSASLRLRFRSAALAVARLKRDFARACAIHL